MTDEIRPKPMEGGGAYNRSSRVQAAGLQPAVALFEEAARTAALLTPPRPLVIADYGSSQGHNSLLPIAVAIGVLRERANRQREVNVIHTDLPDNDFSGLFRTLANDPDSYLRGQPNVFAAAVGRSFYEQILPSESVTLGWSSWAVQWLSRAPMGIPDHVQVAFSRDPAARAAFARQADDDWRRFLAARSRELHPGGRLVVVTMALDETGDFGYRPLLEAMVSGLDEMVREGFLDAEEFRQMTIPTIGRGRADLAAPFAENGSFENLTIEHLEIFNPEDRLWIQYECDGDGRAWAAQWSAFSRASVFPTLAAALTGEPDTPRRAEFMTQLETRVARRLEAAPARMLMPLARMLLTKVV